MYCCNLTERGFKGDKQMRRFSKTIIVSAVIAALAGLVVTGCGQARPENGTTEKTSEPSGISTAVTEAVVIIQTEAPVIIETEPETQPQTQAETQAPETQAQTSAAPAASSTGQAVADYACQFVGNPYVWGGTSLTGGADCSGFTMSVYANFGISLPHSAAAQSGYGTRVSLDSLAPGDLLFYDHGTGSIEHVGIYIGGGSIVHASNSKSGIKISGAFYSSPVCAVRLV